MSLRVCQEISLEFSLSDTTFQRQKMCHSGYVYCIQFWDNLLKFCLRSFEWLTKLPIVSRSVKLAFDMRLKSSIVYRKYSRNFHLKGYCKIYLHHLFCIIYLLKSFTVHFICSSVQFQSNKLNKPTLVSTFILLEVPVRKFSNFNYISFSILNLVLTGKPYLKSRFHWDLLIGTYFITLRSMRMN